MPKTSMLLALAATSLVVLLQAAPAHAQASRTWVSGVGDDANPCSRTAPCKTFAGAISKTALNGEINCLDPGGFGAVTITKSITIDCHEVFASILNSGTNGVNIPFDSFNAADVRKTVRLRNINFNGVDTGVNRNPHHRRRGHRRRRGRHRGLPDRRQFRRRARAASPTSAPAAASSTSPTRPCGIPAPSASPSAGAGTVAGSGSTPRFDNVRVQNSDLSASRRQQRPVMINRSVFTGNAQIGLVASGTPGGRRK